MVLPPTSKSSSAYFVIKRMDPDRDLTPIGDYQFVLGVDSKTGALDGEFNGDFSERCDNHKYCEWIDQGVEIVSEAVGLSAALDGLVKIYNQITKGNEKYQKTKLRSKGFKSTLQETLESIYKTPKRLQITAHSEKQWDIVVDGQYTKIHAKLEIATGFKMYGTLRVISPRLTLGRNVDFGGIVNYKGLSQHSTVNSIKDLITSVYHSLYYEEADLTATTPYTDEEYKACVQEPTIVTTAAMKTPMDVFDDVKDMYSNIDSDRVMINSKLYSFYIGATSAYLYTYIRSDSGKSMWCIVSPSPTLPADKIVISKNVAVGLNYRKGDKMHLRFGNLHVPDHVTIRPRSFIKNTEELKEEFGKLFAINVGKTYTVLLPSTGEFIDIDVFYSGPSGASTLKVTGDFVFYVSVEVLSSLALEVIPVKTPELDPLRVSYRSYDTEESDTD